MNSWEHSEDPSTIRFLNWFRIKSSIVNVFLCFFPNARLIPNFICHTIISIITIFSNNPYSTQRMKYPKIILSLSFLLETFMCTYKLRALSARGSVYGTFKFNYETNILISWYVPSKGNTAGFPQPLPNIQIYWCQEPILQKISGAGPIGVAGIEASVA